jgi:hypothetical protein
MRGFQAHILGAAFIVTLGGTALAQTDTLAPAVDCDAQFTALDTDANGYLTDVEAPREFARTRVDAVTPDADGISKAAFLELCGSDHWTQNTVEEGAPFEGANSFTEDQARDRAIAWNVTEVSALTLDEKGVWRGTGKMAGADVSVAVDYKGNVVTTPKA